ncbi:MAG: hypothetical protein ACHQ3P_10485 [Candidatus Limnocylindrales bacterium]
MGDSDYPTTIDESGNEVLEMPADTITADPHEHEAVAEGYDSMTHRGYTMDAQGTKVEDFERPAEPDNLILDAAVSVGEAVVTGGLAAPHLAFDVAKDLAEQASDSKGSPDYDAPDASVPDATTIDK